MKIVLATHNQGKIREFREAFAELGWDAVPISEIADLPDPEETGRPSRRMRFRRRGAMLLLSGTGAV